MSELQIEIVPITGGVLVRLTGNAAIGCVDRLQFSLLGITAQRPALTIFDLAGIAFAASHFLGALVSFRRGIVRNGGQVRLAALQPNVETAFRSARLDTLFPILDTVEAALADGIENPS